MAFSGNGATIGDLWKVTSRMLMVRWPKVVKRTHRKTRDKHISVGALEGDNNHMLM